MSDILMILPFIYTPGEFGKGRFEYLINMLMKTDVSIEVLTTSFSHQTKKQRKVTEQQKKELDYTLTMLYEPGYKKNVSARRYFSHHILGKSLKKYFRNRKKPDVIYCATPPLSVAKITVAYAKKNGVPFITDIQDIWPEAFKMVFGNSLASRMFFYPLKKEADFIYKNADRVIAVSETYLKRAQSVRGEKQGLSVFLGADIELIDSISRTSEVKRPSDELWIAYIGTLGYSYDIKCIIDALKILKQRGISGVKLMLMGDGPLRRNFEDYAKQSGTDCLFTGQLSYEDMIGILCKCDIAVNPIMAGSAGSIINKVGDYAAVGLPVVSTQQSPEYRSLLEEYECGYSCDNATEVADRLYKLCTDEALRSKMAEKSRRLAEEKFDRAKTYNQITDIIKQMLDYKV